MPVIAVYNSTHVDMFSLWYKLSNWPNSVPHTVKSGAQVPVLIFEKCAISWHRLHGVLIIVGYFTTG